MFGFRKESNAKGRLTKEMVYRLEDVNRRFPGVVPGRNVQIGKLALAIAMKVNLICFNEDDFEKVLVREYGIERDFQPGWNRADALSRWYSLGSICLTHCSMKYAWSDALTVGAGMQVYDATVEKMWIIWSLPDEVKDRVSTFMRTNIKGITSSLDTVIDAKAKAEWFARYVARVKGENPSWEIPRDGHSSAFEALLSGGKVHADFALVSALSARFEVLADGIMNLATGAEQLP